MQKPLSPNIIEELFPEDNNEKSSRVIIRECFDIIDECVIAVNKNGKITFLNSKANKLFDSHANEIIGKYFIKDFIIKEKQENVKTLINKLLNKQKVCKEGINFHIRAKSNNIKILKSKILVVTDKSKDVRGFVILGKDVTHEINIRHELQHDLSLYRIFAKNIPNINLYLFDTDLRFLLAEGNEMKNINLSRKMFEEKTLDEIPNEKIKKLWSPLFISALKGRVVSTEFKIDSYNYILKVIPIKDKNKNVLYGMAISQNITEYKTSENRYKKTKEKADKANKAKSEFIARISHDIRTPLNAITGFTEQLLKTNLNPQQEDYLNIIEKSSEQMLELINDLLMYSKIESRQIRFVELPFKIENTVKYVHSTLLNKAKGKNLELSYDVDSKLDRVIIGDSFRLRQILINMLDNAIKFTDRGFIELNCKLKEETDENILVQFDIIDSGIGISKEQIRNIFKQFQQGDASFTSKYGGTGLGLTICKNLIEKQNGSLTVTSTKGQGSKFSFTIPYLISSEDDIVSDEIGTIASGELKNKKALVVEDDSVNRLLIKIMLETFGCAIDIVNDGKYAIEKLKHIKYDIILLDIHMPLISGFEVAKFLRKDMADNSTKIIALTAAVKKSDIMKIQRSGINDFLIKPFKEIELFNKIREVLDISLVKHEQPVIKIILKDDYNSDNKLYNLSELYKIAKGEKKFINEMLMTFIENAEESIYLFKIFLKEKKWKHISEAAHKLLPSFRHLNIKEVIPLLIDLKDKASSSKEKESIPPLLEKTIIEMKKVIAEIKKEIK